MRLKRYLDSIFAKLLAALLLFLGFGMIHGSHQIIEKLGSIFIGIGALYFIIYLILTMKKSQKHT